ncbi:penicillin acylase family protein [Alicyclobacillus pomorum]
MCGTIPFDDIPQVYTPPSHFVFSANQRVVEPDYPYYIGTSLDFFSDGYRANEIYRTLSRWDRLTVKDMQSLQNDTRDYLASLMVPKLLEAAKGQPLTSNEQSALSLLKSWDYRMDSDSPAAALWWTFWTQYLSDTFQPWWDHFKVPVEVDPSLKVNPNLASLNEDLEAWTLKDPNNAAFSLPNGTRRDANEVMRQSFHEAVGSLSARLGAGPKARSWGLLHSRQFPSLLRVPELGYGPFPSGGDIWSVNAADSADGYLSTAGPSWRFIMDWGTKQGFGVYPGGQSENPLSPWYANFITAWWNGAYYPMQDFPTVDRSPQSVEWELEP